MRTCEEDYYKIPDDVEVFFKTSELIKSETTCHTVKETWHFCQYGGLGQECDIIDPASTFDNVKVVGRGVPAATPRLIALKAKDLNGFIDLMDCIPYGFLVDKKSRIREYPAWKDYFYLADTTTAYQLFCDNMVMYMANISAEIPFFGRLGMHDYKEAHAASLVQSFISTGYGICYIVVDYEWLPEVKNSWKSITSFFETRAAQPIKCKCDETQSLRA